MHYNHGYMHVGRRSSEERKACIITINFRVDQTCASWMEHYEAASHQPTNTREHGDRRSPPGGYGKLYSVGYDLSADHRPLQSMS